MSRRRMISLIPKVQIRPCIVRGIGFDLNMAIYDYLDWQDLGWLYCTGKPFRELPRVIGDMIDHGKIQSHRLKIYSNLPDRGAGAVSSITRLNTLLTKNPYPNMAKYTARLFIRLIQIQCEYGAIYHRFVHHTAIRNKDPALIRFIYDDGDHIFDSEKVLLVLLGASGGFEIEDGEFNANDFKLKHSKKSSVLFNKTWTPQIIDWFLSKYPHALSGQMFLAAFVGLPDHAHLVIPILAKRFKLNTLGNPMRSGTCEGFDQLPFGNATAYRRRTIPHHNLQIAMAFTIRETWSAGLQVMEKATIGKIMMTSPWEVVLCFFETFDSEYSAWAAYQILEWGIAQMKNHDDPRKAKLIALYETKYERPWDPQACIYWCPARARSILKGPTGAMSVCTCRGLPAAPVEETPEDADKWLDL